MHLIGHSAGAHLAAMCLNHEWRNHGLPPQPLRSVAAISGVYDPGPVPHTTINQDVRLDAAMLARINPMLHPPTHPEVAMLVAVGDLEPPGWIQQSRDWHELCRARGLRCDYLQLGAEDHFSILDLLADPRHPMTAWVLRRL
jgi:arylformamidase